MVQTGISVAVQHVSPAGKHMSPQSLVTPATSCADWWSPICLSLYMGEIWDDGGAPITRGGSGAPSTRVGDRPLSVRRSSWVTVTGNKRPWKITFREPGGGRHVITVPKLVEATPDEIWSWRFLCKFGFCWLSSLEKLALGAACLFQLWAFEDYKGS
jgi:hypothetical protein